MSLLCINNTRISSREKISSGNILTFELVSKKLPYGLFLQMSIVLTLKIFIMGNSSYNYGFRVIIS